MPEQKAGGTRLSRFRGRCPDGPPAPPPTPAPADFAQDTLDFG